VAEKINAIVEKRKAEGAREKDVSFSSVSTMLVELGLMQIDSQHFNELSRYGIKPDHLLSDACLNIYTGAYYLAQAFKKWGVSWDAVGAYNAGFKKTPRQAARRYEYAKKIHYYYTAIKASKRTSSKDQKIAMN
ncbi:transglycosylase SLT domain-containing protein, partial [Klebsiella pneumoniae]|uniref:transglycosylase SLT domain-containing protein n=1 Tax=Klebsiella pneumoniae TaxID=573 RepID=UPI00200C698C